jgi:hypothetical protein
MPARRVCSQDLAARGDLEAFCDGFTCLAASDRFRHEPRKIEEIAVVTRVDCRTPVSGAGPIWRLTETPYNFFAIESWTFAEHY